MDNVKQRLLQYAKSQDVGMMEFYEKSSISQSNFSGKGGESALSTDKIIHILITFPDLNPDWLLLGKGEMLRKNEEKNINFDLLDMVSLDKYVEKVEECALLRAQLTALKEHQNTYLDTKKPYKLDMVAEKQ